MKKFALVSFGVAVAAMIFVSGVFAATVVVHPGDLDGWVPQTSGTGQTVTFVNGPATPPAGTGSAEFSVGPDGNGAAQLRNVDYAGTRLDALTELTYSTYVQNWVDGQVVYIILGVDYDNNGSQDDLLFFEPVYQDATFCSNAQSSPALNTWQTWDALNGCWWSVNGTAGAGPGTDTKTLTQILSAEPDATIVNSATGLGGVRLVAGFGAGAWDNFIGNADQFVIGVSGSSTTYDFELTAPVVTPADKDACKKDGWQDLQREDGSTFTNQGDCIQYVNTGK